MTGCVPCATCGVAKQNVGDDRLAVEPVKEGLAHALILEEFGLLRVEIRHVEG